MRSLAVVLFWLLWPALATGQVTRVLTPAEADAAFRAANDACLKDDSATCIDGFEKLLVAGYGGVDLEYNLGTAYLKKGRLGYAVLHLERALRLDPSDADARANLERAQKMRVDKLVGAPEETGGQEPWTAQIVSHTSGDRWALAFLLLWGLGGLGLVLRRLVQAGGRRTLVLLSCLLLVVAALPCLVVTAVHYHVRERAHEAVVVASSLSVREGPTDAAKAPFEVHEGLKVRVVDQEGGFRRVRLSNGLQGWVTASGVVEL
jgi:tetratricopeptide (TPR) repeat protein